MSGPIVGIILAAGSSRRLGRPKQLLDLGGRPLIAHVVDRALSARLDSVVLVTGHARYDVEGAIAGRNVTTIFNPRYRDGQSTSLISGLEGIPEGTDAIVVLLGDQPMLEWRLIDALIDRRRMSGDPIIMTGYGDTRSHPVLFGSEVFTELAAISGDQGARDVIKAHLEDVSVVPSGLKEPSADVDTEAAYDELLAIWNNLLR